MSGRSLEPKQIWHEHSSVVIGAALTSDVVSFQHSVSRVAKAISQLTLIEQHLDQMPLTKVYLDSLAENIEDYQIRWVRWAAARLDRRGEEVLRWKVVRMAGLRPDYSEKVEQAIDEEVCAKCR